MKNILLIGSLLCLPASSVFAQDKLPEGEGKALVQKVCSSCHGLDTALEKKHTEPEWKTVVDSMAGRGAEATDAEFDLIVKYLAKNFARPGA